MIQTLVPNIFFILWRIYIYIFRKKFDLPERVRSNRYPRTGSDKAIEIYGYSCPRNDERRRRCIDNWRKIRVTKSPRRGRDYIERLCRFPPNEPWSLPRIRCKWHNETNLFKSSSCFRSNPNKMYITICVCIEWYINRIGLRFTIAFHLISSSNLIVPNPCFSSRRTRATNASIIVYRVRHRSNRRKLDRLIIYVYIYVMRHVRLCWMTMSI